MSQSTQWSAHGARGAAVWRFPCATPFHLRKPPWWQFDDRAPPRFRCLPAGAEGRRAYPGVAWRPEGVETPVRPALHKRQGDAQASPLMSQNSTARSRDFRQRKRAGLIRLVVEVDEDQVCDWLVAGGVLNPLDADQHDKVEQALERAVVLLISDANNQPCKTQPRTLG
jgi:hypothetical protein